MVMVTLKCPFCGSEKVRKYGHNNGQQRYLCENEECKHKTFYAEYTYKACTPAVRAQIIKMSVDGSGIRAIARVLEISTSTVISVLKQKGSELSYINEDYFKSHDKITIHIEMDEMWSFYHDKEHQIWLWWAIDHDSGEVIAYWFGTREHKNLDELKKLLDPLTIGNVYVDGNYAYFQRFSNVVVTKKNTQKIERKHLSLRTWCARLVRKGIRFSKTREMHIIVVGLVINVCFFGLVELLQ
jgi:IS1 family transposase/transposase-like protein